MNNIIKWHYPLFPELCDMDHDKSNKSNLIKTSYLPITSTRHIINGSK